MGRVRKARAHRVHANAASLKSTVHVRANERTAACGAINTPVGQPFTGDDDAFRMIDAPSALSGSAFCTVKRRPFTLLLKSAS